jgi:hypothetical protein
MDFMHTEAFLLQSAIIGYATPVQGRIRDESMSIDQIAMATFGRAVLTGTRRRTAGKPAIRPR